MVIAFYILVPMWLPYLPLGAQLLGFALPQHSGMYPCWVYCLVLMVCEPCQEYSEWLLFPILWVEGSFMVLIQLSPQPFHQYCGPNSFGGPHITICLHLPNMVGSGILFQIVLHLRTQITLNLWWALNLVMWMW